MFKTLSDDQIDICTTPPRYTKEKGNIKEKYIRIFNEITHHNNKIEERYDNLVTQLEELGCNLDDIKAPRYIPILDEWFEWSEYYDYKVNYSIGCHSETKFYNFLKEQNLLEKYFPQWYRDGHY